MYQIKVNDKFNYEVDKKGEEISINNKKVEADIKQINANSWHIIDELRSFNVEVVNFDSALKTAEIKVNNNTYHITAKDQYDALLDKMGFSSFSNAKVSEAKAPMPGMVLKVFVAEGDEIKKGDNLFILEAMKMENIIKSLDDLVVKAVKIKAGDKVEKGQVLVQFA